MKKIYWLISIVALFVSSPVYSQITCQANFCYEAHLNISNQLCVSTYNLSESNDSITVYSWTGPAGFSSNLRNINNVCFPALYDTIFLTLFITTTNDCHANITKMVIADTTCDSLITGIKSDDPACIFVFYSLDNNSIIIRNSAPTNSQKFCLYDMLGREVMPVQTINKQMEIINPVLPKGIYFYSITDNLKLVKKGKLLIVR